MQEILFATTNPRKVNEANKSLESFGIVVKPVSVEIEEIQHHDPVEITKAKAKSAYAVLEAPVVVSDTSWDIPALGGFPGGYMKDIGIWWSEEDWLAIIARHDDRSIKCLEHIAYYDGSNLEHFYQVYEGIFLPEARGPVVNEIESFERVISLNGTESLSEQISNKNFGASLLGHWKKFGEWLSKE